jgi:rod shape-determining protein MreD
MGNYFGIPLLIVAALLQATVIPQIRVFGGEPDLVFLVVLAYAIRAPFDEGVVWALFGGIVHDLLASTPTGTTALALLIVVFVLDRLRTQIAGVGFLSRIGLTLIGTLIVKGVTILVLSLIGYGTRSVEALTYVVLPSIAYNLVLIVPVYAFVRGFCPSPNYQG